MSLSSYNRIYNLSLAVVVLYNIMCLADIILSGVNLISVIEYSAVVYLIFAFGMLIYKIQLTRRFFLGNDVIYNLIAHGVLAILSLILILIIVL
ncbi:MAG: hypothetical protein IJW86_08310 [Clostridia bacterium]|nr:hypothetical protein [Clostridia bacterium]